MTRRQTKQDYIARHQTMAAKDFERHVIRSRDDRSWRVQRHYKDGNGWDGTFSYEVLALPSHGALFVHGDINCVYFAQYGDSANPEHILRWIGTSDVGYYVLQKARIGMCLPSDCDGLLEVLDEGVWLDYALDDIEQRLEAKGLFDQEDVDLEPYKDRLPEWLYDAVSGVLDGREVREVVRELEYNEEAYNCEIYRWGLVPSSRLICAHEAIKKLVGLLDAEEQDHAGGITA